MKIRIVDLLKSDIYGIDVYVRGWFVRIGRVKI